MPDYFFLSGLIQDSVVAAHLLTSRCHLFERSDFMQMMMHADVERSDLPMPAILKPEVRWTGHQVFSLTLPPSLSMKMQDEGKETLVIRRGKLLKGSLSKTSLGPSSGGIVHITAKLIATDEALRFMERAQRLCAHFLSHHGFSIGIADCKVSSQIKAEIQNTVGSIIQHAKDVDALGKEVGVERPVRESAVHNVLSKALTVCSNSLQSRHSDVPNALRSMINAKSKGGPSNHAQIAVCVGQQNIEGRRVINERCPTQRTLPWFPKNCDTPESHGFVTSSFEEGLSPPATFFHSMSGRRGKQRRVNVSWLHRVGLVGLVLESTSEKKKELKKERVKKEKELKRKSSKGCNKNATLMSF